MQLLVGLGAISKLLGQLPAGEGWLSGAERARWLEMKLPARRAQFLAGHGYARQLLARFDGGVFEDWSLSENEHGAPLATRRGVDVGLHVSISHSGGQLACAVAAKPVGVDIEQLGRKRDLPKLAKSLYPPAFSRALASEDAALHSQRFYRRWTLDEARAKATGRGLLRTTLAVQEWLPMSGPRADGWTWDLPSGCLAVAVLECAGEPVEFIFEGDAPTTGAHPWCWRVCTPAEMDQ